MEKKLAYCLIACYNIKCIGYKADYELIPAVSADIVNPNLNSLLKR